MDDFGIVVAFGFAGLVLLGALMGFVSTFRINGLERTAKELRQRIDALQAEIVRLRSESNKRPAPESPTPESSATIRHSAGDSPAEAVPPAAAVTPEADPGHEATPEAIPETTWQPREAATTRERGDLESMVAGRWLNRIGIVAVLIATAFFLKLAIDNEWIGPVGRVAIGLVAGVLLLAASGWLLRRGYTYFSEGITALGGGVLFLALYAAWDFYSLVGQPVALAGMVATTAALAWIAASRDSERLACLALGAGLLAPALLLRDDDPHAALFAYLSVLVAAFLLLALRQGWRTVAPLALIGVLLHGLPWFAEHYTPATRVSFLGFATLHFALFHAYTVVRVRRSRRLDLREIFLPAANAAWFALALYATLFDDHRWVLTTAMLVMGGAYLAALALVPERDDRQSRTIRLVLGGLALTCLTATAPIRLEGSWITIAWAVEASALVWAGFESRIKPLRAAGMALFLPVLGLLASQDEPTTRLFLNERFAAFLTAGVGLAASALRARRHQDELGPDERHLFPALGVAAVALAVWSLSVELWYGLERWNLTDDLELTRQLGLSLLWILSATLLIAVGMRRDSKPLRLEGLVLLGLTIVKVFVSDLSFLDNVYRVASFLVLGIVLLAISFKYQRAVAGREDGDGG